MSKEFKDELILLSDWECPTIVNRKDEIKKLNESIIEYYIQEKGIPRAIYTYGGSGSGKTYVITKQIKDNLKDINKHLPNFKFIYINLKTYVPSYYTVLQLILDELKVHLPVEIGSKQITSIPLRGLDKTTLIKIILQIIKQNKLILLIVIDEIDRLIEYEKNDDFIYALSEYYKEFTDLFVGLTPVFISNDINLLNKIKRATFDRLPTKIQFPPYDMSDLFQILKTTADFSLYPNAYTDKILEEIANYVAIGSKSAREGKLLLYNYVKTKDLESAKLETDKDMLRDEISRLSFHQLLVLSSVSEMSKQIQKMYKRNTPKKYYDIQPTAGNVWEMYIKVCDKVQEPPKSYKTFHRLTRQLNQDHLLYLKTGHSHVTRGLTSFMTLGDTAIESLVIQALKERLETKTIEPIYVSGQIADYIGQFKDNSKTNTVEKQ